MCCVYLFLDIRILKEMVNNSNKKYFILTALFYLIIIGVIFYFIRGSNFSDPISGLGYLERIILGDVGIESLKDISSEGGGILDGSFDKKNYRPVIGQSREVFLTLGNKGDKWLFNNGGGSDLNFYLEKNINRDTYLQITYDETQRKLNFVLPRREIIIKDSPGVINEKEFFSLDNIAADHLLRFNGRFLDMFDRVGTNLSVEDIENKEIMVFKPTRDVLSDNESISFENGLWQKEPGDCSNKLEGVPEIMQEVVFDATEGYTALKLSSVNHHACTNKTFPVQIQSDKIYRLSFDYKNITGEDIRYYYKLHNENNIISSGFASAETINAKDDKWHTYSIVIDPEKIKENFVYPEYDNKEGQEDLLASNEGVSNTNVGDPIKSIKYIDLYLYAPSDGSKEVTNLYDNIQLKEYSLSETRKIDIGSLIDKDIVLAKDIFLDLGENDFGYVVNKSNLIDSEDASFESGLWQEKPGDCSDTRPGDPDLGVRLSLDASDGNQSMELSSKNHFACVSKTFSVEILEGMRYKLQFDYKNIRGGKVMYYYNLRSGDQQDSHSEMIQVRDSNWHIYEKIIDPEISDIKSISIFFYASSDGSQEVDNLYDNVRLTEYQPKDIDSYYLHATQQVDESPKLRSVEYKAVNHWKEQVVLHGVKNSFLLVYPEQYSENWKAYPIKFEDKRQKNLNPLGNYSVSDVESNRQATKSEAQGMIDQKLISASGNEFISKNFDGSIRNDNLPNGHFWETWGKATIPEDTHYKINNYSNSWWINVDDLCKNRNICKKNDDGTYDILLVVENDFNRYFYMGFIVIGIIFVGCLGYVGYDLVKRRRMAKAPKVLSSPNLYKL